MMINTYPLESLRINKELSNLDMLKPIWCEDIGLSSNARLWVLAWGHRQAFWVGIPLVGECSTWSPVVVPCTPPHLIRLAERCYWRPFDGGATPLPLQAQSRFEWLSPLPLGQRSLRIQHRVFARSPSPQAKPYTDWQCRQCCASLCISTDILSPFGGTKEGRYPMSRYWRVLTSPHSSLQPIVDL